MENTQQDLMALYRKSRGLETPSATDEETPEVVEALDTDSLMELYRKSKEQNPHASLINSEAIKRKPSFFDRVFLGPLERSGERIAGLTERATAYAEGPIIPTSPEELAEMSSSKRTDINSMVIQTVAEPLSILFDAAGETLLFGAEKAIGVLATDEQQKKALQYVTDFMNTKAGQAFGEALQAGSKGINSFMEKYPNEAANLRAIADLTGSGVFKNFSKSVLDANDGLPNPKNVSFIEKVGLRRVDKPLAGEDQDLWNMAFNTGDGLTEEQMDRMLPSTFLGRNRHLASQEELDIIDELKSAGISGDMNPIDAHVQLKAQIDKLEEVLVQMSRGSDAVLEIDANAFRQIMQEKLKNIAQQYPKAFKNRKAAKNIIDGYVAQFEAFVAKHGRTAEGLREARKDFDNWLETTENIPLGESNASLQGIIGRFVRESANEAIAANVPESAELLARMNKLLKVKPAFYQKAKRTSQTAVGRYLQWVGFDDLSGRTAFSQIYNIPVALGFSVVRAPAAIIGRVAKTKYAAKGRAAFTYAMRDIFKEINDKMKTASKSERAQWLKEKGVFYAGVREAVQTLQEQYDSEQEEAKDEQEPASNP